MKSLTKSASRKTNYEDSNTYIAINELYDYGLVPEHKFHPVRKWRFDFACLEWKIAIEIEGGTWVSGRHNHPGSVIKDMEKYNAAAKLGWRVLRYTPQQWKQGLPINDVKEMLYGNTIN